MSATRYVVDDNGNRLEVVLKFEDYAKLLEDAEELEAIRAFDRAKSSGEESVPFEQAVSEIERRKE